MGATIKFRRPGKTAINCRTGARHLCSIAMGAIAPSQAGLGLADPRALLRRLFEAALAAADPATVVPPHLPAPPKGRTLVVGAGKAAAAMAAAVEAHWPGPLAGLVVTRYGYGEACKKIEIVEAAHPVPDEKGRAAARRILEKVKGLSEDDLVLCQI